MKGKEICFRIYSVSDWLYSKGGRSMDDVYDDRDGNGPYVEMWNKGYRKVYIPQIFLI